MSDPQIYFVYPLRYYPKLVTGEFLNVGVGIVAPEVKWWGIRVVKDFKGFNRLFPTAQPRALRSSLVRIDRVARRMRQQSSQGPVAASLEILLDDGRWETPRDPLESLVSGNRGALRWGESLVEGAGSDLASELDHWYRELVQIRKSEVSTKAGASDDELEGELRLEFQRRGILGRLRPADVGSYHRRRFEYTHRNGHLNVFETIDLNFKTRDTILNRGEVWRGGLDVLAESEKGMKFHALVRFPRRRDLREDAEVALKMIEHSEVGFEAFPRERLGDFGMTAARIVGE